MNGLIHGIESRIDDHMASIGPYIVAAMESTEDDVCSRLACGLVSDLSGCIDRRISKYLPDFMSRLNKVLSSNDYSTETKLNAIIAVGDICLASEDEFHPYLEETMRCLSAAA